MPSALDLDARVLARARAAALDEAGDAEAVIAAVDQLALERELFVPARFREAAVERAGIVAAVAGGLAEAVVRPHRRQRIRHLVERHEIAAADLEPVEPQLARRHLEQPLHEEAALEPARPAIGAGRRLVADMACGFSWMIGHAIGAGGELRDVAHRRHAVRPHIGADIDLDVAAHAEDHAVAVERDSMSHSVSREWRST